MEALREFFTLNPYQLARVLIFIGVFALSVLLLSIVVSSISWKLFEKAGRNPREAFFPVYNLIVLLQIAEIPSYFFFTLLVPGLNIILLLFVLYKLGKLFKVNNKFMVGLILCPIVFLPVLAHGNYIYKEPEEEVFISVSDEMPTILSQAKIEELNKQEVFEEKVDNIFRSNIQTQEEEVKPYKANKVIVDEEFISKSAPKEDGIKRVKAVKAFDIQELEKAKYIDDEKIEIVEL